MPVGRGSVLLAAVLGSGVVFLDGTVVNLALETIGNELPSTVLGRLEGLTYVTSGYLAVLAALLILAGAMGDTFGRRRVFGIGLVGFAITSIACGLAPSLELLVLFRLAQGATGALLVPGALALITSNFDGEARGRAIGTWAAATSAVTLLGPLVGGILVQSVSWRATFLINVPLIVVALVALRNVPESRDETASGQFDWLGAAVIALAVGGLAFGATRGQQEHWEDPLAWTALVVGAVALVAFPFLMLRRPHPLVPLGLFRSRAFSTINLATFVIYGALYMTLTYQALFLQGTLGYTPLGAGLAGLPSSLLLILLSTQAGRYAARLGPRRFLVVGPVTMAVGLLWLARIPATSTPWQASPGDPASLVPPTSYLVDVLPAMLVFGFGLSLLVAPLTTALMASIPLRNVGLGSAVNNAVSRVGAPLAGAALFIVVSATFYPTLAGLVPGLDVDDPAVQEAVQPLAPPAAWVPPEVAAAANEASTQSFHLAMFVSASLLAIGAVVSGIGLRSGPQVARPHDAVPSQDQAPPEAAAIAGG
jgi:EmrB/QacA subfamily drug resistance transporter